ncbi:hypothetical protein ACS0TY_021376 [Phlomoides rotata]
MHASSESDITSSASPRAYYVQSPSSHDDIDKCSSSSNGPPSFLSPSDPRHSLTSSSSTAISRIFGNRRRWNKHYCDVVVEEGGDDDYYGSRAYAKHCNSMIVALTFVLLFLGIGLAVWGVSMHYKAQVSVKSLRIFNVYYGEGTDGTGVPTQLMSVNCSAGLVIHNPATYFGIQLTSSHSSANLIFSHITVASGQVKKQYQPRKSTRMMWVRLVGKEVPLYGAGMALVTAGTSIPMKLELQLESKANVVAHLINTKHTLHVSCFFHTDTHSSSSQHIKFHNNACKYF